MLTCACIQLWLRETPGKDLGSLCSLLVLKESVKSYSTLSQSLKVNKHCLSTVGTKYHSVLNSLHFSIYTTIAKETRQRKPILRAKTRSREHTSSTRRCPNCYRPVDEQHRALSCVGCRFWFHQTCAHLSDKVFKEYVSHSYTKFRCNNCCPDTVKDPDPETETEKPSSAQSSEQSTTLDPGMVTLQKIIPNREIHIMVQIQAKYDSVVL